MQESSSKESVSHSHSLVTPKDSGLTGSSGVKAITQKKSQIQKALGEFDSRVSYTSTQKKSLLSDEDSVLHVGNERRGTIIKDTKRKRWSFTAAVKDSFGGWLKNEKTKVEKTLKKPIPKKVVEASSTRTEVIKKAAHMSAIAGTDTLKKTTLKKPIPKPTNSSIRIKPKDVPKEIGNTKPRWTHLIDEEIETVSHVTPITSQATQAESRLLDAPDSHLLLPERAGLIKAETVKKEYRTPRISHIVAVTKTPAVDPKTHDIEDVHQAQDEHKIKKVASIKPTTDAYEQNRDTIEEDEKPKVVLESTTEKTRPSNEVILENKDSAASPPADAPNKSDAAQLLEGRLQLPTTTFVMVILFITVISISTFSWKVIENRKSAAELSIATMASIGLITADKTITLNVTKDSLTNELIRTAAANTGFTQFEIHPNDVLQKTVSNWNELFSSGLTLVEVGALNTHPYFVIKTDSKEISLAAMLSLETNIPLELKTVYESSNGDKFSSGKMSTNDMRILQDKDTVKFVYVVRNDGIILLAKNADDIAALIDRIK